MKMNVKKGDTVLMIAGKDKGKKGKITSCDPKSGRVVVEGCNIITKHTKPRGANQPGGINKMAGPVDVSNVQLICPVCNKATRVAHKEERDKKVRDCNKCGASLDTKKVEKKSKKGKTDKAEAVEAETEVKEKTTAKKTAAKKPAAKKTAAEKPAAKKTVKPEAENTADTANGGEN